MFNVRIMWNNIWAEYKLVPRKLLAISLGLSRSALCITQFGRKTLSPVARELSDAIQ